MGDENRCTRRPLEFRCDQQYHRFKIQMLFFTDGVGVFSASLICSDSKCSDVI